MRGSAQHIVCSRRFIAVLALATICLASSVVGAASAVERGRDVAFARDKGNCLACHKIAGGTQMGDIGPPLIDMRARYPQHNRLREQIWDAGQYNDNSLMPPFGRHEILTDAEIEALLAFLYTL